MDSLGVYAEDAHGRTQNITPYVVGLVIHRTYAATRIREQDARRTTGFQETYTLTLTLAGPVPSFQTPHEIAALTIVQDEQTRYFHVWGERTYASPGPAAEHEDRRRLYLLHGHQVRTWAVATDQPAREGTA